MSHFERRSSPRRQLIAGLAIGLVVGAGGGAIVGRTTSPTLAERVAEVRARGRDVASPLRLVAGEYEQGKQAGGAATDGGTTGEAASPADAADGPAAGGETEAAAAMVETIERRLRRDRASFRMLDAEAYDDAIAALDHLHDLIAEGAAPADVERAAADAQRALEPLT